MCIYLPFFREKTYMICKIFVFIFEGIEIWDPTEKLRCSKIYVKIKFSSWKLPYSAHYYPNRHMGTIMSILSMFSLLCALKSSKVTANRLLERRAHQWIVFLPRLENEAEINGTTIYDLTMVLFLFVKVMRLAFWHNFSRTSKIHQWARCETK